MLAHAVRRVPLAAWVLLIALMPILARTLQAFGHLPLGGDIPVGLHDPDSWLRLTLVRDWLQGGSWYDHTYQSNAPFDAITSPWTRPLDIVIALLVKLQFTSVDLITELVRASFMLPLIWMTGLVLALITITRRLTAMPHAQLMLGVLLVTAPINYNYFGPGNADHHAPLSMLFCWVVALLLNYEARRANGITLMGVLLALMLWISPEALLIIALVYGWFGLRWLVGDSLKPLIKLSTVTVFAAAAALAIESHPSQWLTVYYDRISISQIVALAFVALSARLLGRISSFFWAWRGLAAAAILFIVVAGLYGLDPKFFQGPLAAADDYIRSDFMPRIWEAKPAWSQHWLKLIGLLIQPLVAICVAFRCATQRNGIIAPAKAVPLLYLLVSTLLLYLTQLRWAYYFFPLVPLVLAPYIAAWLNPQHRAVDAYWPASKLRRLADKPLMLRRLPLLLFLLAVPSICIIGSALIEKETTTDISDCPGDLRRLIQNGEIDAINGGKPLTIFTATDMGAEILFFTHDRPISGNYHREGPGIKTVWDAQIDTDLGDFRKAVRQRKPDLVILCHDGGAPDDAALHRLREGKLPVPSYLKPYAIKTKGLSKHPPSIFLVNGAAR